MSKKRQAKEQADSPAAQGASAPELIQEDSCPICDRKLGLINIDKHHLVPKTHGGKAKFWIHKICHRKIHATFTEKELEKTYFTWETLRQHPVIQDFINWVQKKDPSFYIGSAETTERNQKRRR